MSRRSKGGVANSKSKRGKTARAARLAGSETHELVKWDPNESALSAQPNSKKTPFNFQRPVVRAVDMPAQEDVSFSQASGSHTFTNATFVNCVRLTIGNTASNDGDGDGNRDSTITKGHTYDGFSVSQSRCVHMGNTGTGNEGHKYNDVRVDNTMDIHEGDFSTVAVKYRNFQVCQSRLKQDTTA